MLTLQLSDLTLEEFLADYWQQKPVLLRQGFPYFHDLLRPDELAGLACEEQISSRLIYKKDQQWQAETGPFDNYGKLGHKDWTLVVQAVDHWSPEVARLVDAFSFLPTWRLDDVMISYATPGGGVGPHIDLYDVFICQGSGRRRWRVGARGPHRQFAAHPALWHTEAFDALIDVEVSSGDILYIPPGFPHEGVSLENSMSFSVGFRSKSARDMLSGLADYLIDEELGEALISDPGRPLQTYPAQISRADVAALRAQMQAVLDDDALVADFIAGFLSKTRNELDLQELEEPLESAQLAQQLQQFGLVRTGGLRCFYVDEGWRDGVCHVDGQRRTFGAASASVVRVLCDQKRPDSAVLSAALEDADFAAALLAWVNQGYWYFDE
ncbi:MULTISPECIES: cupin domain-containing protein [unclassified Undibacterium]|uniref:cupin domain-containing protein n=1 Tax=unclassified Undibacterium TaxID=2630295 RepID=UPI002AC92DDF|nr:MULTISPECIES: cupin domain-containing protein [unclassified Undibacterium]MEB0140748.1 cupin domain-containing protein [Undibacterium sp. CCC2.1]MEB0174251.1 cupin domain-containing protein [Undibacterium sp. CCC1.1]MEB0177367.1 cupin domain-containing protein [Undibacterium sp. CCC3.4]MEB0216936.1 cupin domain-containing protein [Undibacterium sp. 5I2]WPX44545.1 cupin domain-containing protein [Undibacterium sp. CCC3.4]